jgi:hypothetical protein
MRPWRHPPHQTARHFFATTKALLKAQHVATFCDGHADYGHEAYTHAWTTPMPGKSGRVLVARICIRAGPARCPGIRSAGCQQDDSHERKRPMTAGSRAFGQRSYRTRRNLLLSHPVPGQPRRLHAPVEGALPNRPPLHHLTSHASPKDSAARVPAGDGSRQRRLPRRRLAYGTSLR